MSKDRWTGVLGIASIAFFAAYVAVTASVAEPGSGASRSEWRSYYLDGGNQSKLQVGLILIGAAAFFFLPFLAGLRARLGRLRPDSWLPTAAFAGGIGFLTLMLAFAGVNAAVAAAADFFDHYRVNVDIGQTLNSLSWPLIGYSGIAGGVLVGSASLAALRPRAIPKSLAVAGLAVAVAGFFSYFTFGVSNGLELVWVLAVSVTLVSRRRAPEPVPAAA